MITICARVAAQALLIVAITACAVAPQENFYTLQPLPSVHTPSLRTPSLAVVVGPVNLPPMVNRPQWVVRRNATEVRVLEQQRWAHSLDEDMAQAVADHINARLNTSASTPTSPFSVLAYAQTDRAAPSFSTQPTLRVKLNVVRFTSLMDPLPSIDDQFQWAVSCVATAAQEQASTWRERTGVFTSEREVIAAAPHEKTVYSDIAAAHAKALQKVSTDIAEAVRELGLQCPIS